jgi:UDP-GlcNAc:undecaprenyl-phosphate/decaprenyl-phosphate GlcNAc-1-phosphate transferase
MPESLNDLLPAGMALVLTLVSTPLVRTLARRWGAVARPRGDRWHKQPTAMLGGLAIFPAVLLTYLLTFPRGQADLVVGGSALLFLLGLVDDLLRIKPYQKLIGQMIGAAVLIAGGLSLSWTPSLLVNMLLTLFWLIGITNAVNLLDNMDGLAAGIAAIAAGFLTFCFLDNGQPVEAALVGMLAAALLGFLVYNWNPASIFMGDCGSLFIGFFLAGASLLNVSGGRSRGFVAVLAVPVLIFLVPIFDTTLVTITRKLIGRRLSHGGRDHTSHRLVAWGMSERRAVAMLYAFTALSGALALLVRDVQFDLSLAALTGLVIVLTLLGIHLARVKVYDENEFATACQRPVVAFLINLSYKRRVFEVLLDVVLIALAYYCACRLLYGPLSEHPTWDILVPVVPLLVFLKLAAFLGMGVYRGIWRYFSLSDVAVFAGAIALGSLLSIPVIRVALSQDDRRLDLFFLEGSLLFVFVTASRIVFRLFRALQPLPATRVGGRRVLIYGAGDGGEILLREILNNPALEYVPVGFADDDPLKQGKKIHGFRVLGGNDALLEVCQVQRVDEVIVASARFSEERLDAIRIDCEKAGIGLKRMRIDIAELAQGASA